jgi:hypothetical protein
MSLLKVYSKSKGEIMPEIKLPTAYKVVIFECERGWGCKVDDVKYFSTETEAVNYVKGFNSVNTDEVAPDWYMTALYQGIVE